MNAADRSAQDAAGTAAQLSSGELGFVFDNSYARDLQGLYVAWRPTASPVPRLLQLNRTLAIELGLDADALASSAGLAVLAGNAVPEGASPLAQAYAGHQFGGFSPQLGDGRALLLGEVIDRAGQRRDIAFKGSGRTPFSRGGDGKAVMGPVLREYLIGEAMHALGIPTTRVLAAVATGEAVMRETAQPGALLCRVAASHLRVGTFEYAATKFASPNSDDGKGGADFPRRLADYAIARHEPALNRPDPAPGERYLGLLRGVARRQAALIARWMGVGFIHGVMNTDNMTISGETIDYGPCAFMEAFDPKTVFSSIDRQGRYAYGNQPGIAQWNLARLAETLLPLLDKDSERAIELATGVIHQFPAQYQVQWLNQLRTKLGLIAAPTLTPTSRSTPERDEADLALGNSFLQLLHENQVDFTLAFRHLAAAANGDEAPLLALFGDKAPAASAWLPGWRESLVATGAALPDIASRMNAVNPLYIPRNHQVEAALKAAVQQDDLAPFERLLAVLQQPFEERPGDADYALPAPAAQTACYKTFCGT